MELLSNPVVGSTLGIANVAATAYVYTALNGRLNALEARCGSKGSGASASATPPSRTSSLSRDPAMLDLYQRLEAIEDYVHNEAEARFQRLEAMTNRIIAAVEKTGVRIPIEHSIRRIPIDGAPTDLGRGVIAAAIPIPIPQIDHSILPVPIPIETAAPVMDNDDDVEMALKLTRNHE